ncbi:tetratricopeptide repeat protein [Bradyrhizobium sp. STM 3562]|uniref:tetratricopeptide repeat protein n=1 Tax=Bradyrhizobium sp. STM 3562 TaxID=578924 RepID=UPI00388F68E6
MARTAVAGFWLLIRAGARSALRWLGIDVGLGVAVLCAGMLLLNLTSPAAAQSDPVRGEATFAAADGYARLVFKFAEDVGTEVTTAGNIVVIRFERPVDIPVEKIAEAVPDYVSMARRDPDGTAIRLSLSRKVTLNTMTAGERVFVDFLPDGWNGPPPSLPLEVVKELAERARVAERALRMQRTAAETKKRPPIRVRALMQPTFVRFVFEMPDGVGASSVLNDQKLTLSFSSLLSFDLADAKLAAPPNIASITQRTEGDSTQIEIALIGDVDVHSFREDKNYNVDVAFQQADKPKAQLSVTGVRAPPDWQVPAAARPTAAETPAKPQAGEAAPAKAEPVAAPASVDTKSETVAPKPDVKAEIRTEPKSEQAGALGKIEGKGESVAKPQATPESKPEAAPAAATAAEKPIEPAPAARTMTETANAPSPPAAIIKPAAADVAPKATPAAPPPDNAVPAKLDAIRDSDGLRLTFSFAKATPAASFRRGDTVWLVFDSRQPIDVEPIRAKGGAIVGDVSRMALDKGQAIRIRLNRPQMHTLSTDDYASGSKWTLTFADKVLAPPQPLMVVRNITDPAHANIAVPFANPGEMHRITDPDAGDTLLVVTGLAPTRGLIKRQDFVDLMLLDTAQGVVVRPNSDSVVVEVAPDKVIVGKPGGLTISSVDVSAERAATAVRPIFDISEWHKNQAGDFLPRQDALIAAAGTAEPEQRAQARLDLARFYMARGLYAEAAGEAAFALADPTPRMDESVVRMVHAIASILINRPNTALKDLANPVVGNNYDSQLWKGLAYAKQGKWADAREKLKNVEFAIAALPVELQRLVTMDAMRACLEVRDFAGAAKRRAELEVVGVPPEIKPMAMVLYGRLAEALGQERDALDDYGFAIASSDRAAAAEAMLRQVALLQKRDEINQADVLKQLETLSVTWRGDSIEVQTLAKLAKLYGDAARYSDSLGAARMATRLDPNSEASRQAQDAAQALFSDIFLTAKGDEMPPIDALSLFYEFRELTPIGRRGDEMIRRLSDRLVAVDLLDQAAELLQYQIDKRLEGAARAQVAAKLAMVYLTNRKPDRALTALNSTRIADLNGELRAQRLLLEARAQSDIGRHDLALDIISNISGREAIRLRSDIYWAARRWREASEQIELYYGDRWRDFKPLNPAEKADVIRAVVGYALAEDAIGLARFREKYVPLMSGEADKVAFDIASRPAASNSGEFTEIAKMAASVDTLDGFLREMKNRFPDATAWTPQSQKADPAPTGSLPQIVGIKRADASR